jgi:NADH-quinone oxidoreductase subunit N
MYFDEPVEPIDRAIGRDLRLVMLGTGALVALFFLFPQPVLSSAATAAASLFGG